MPCHVDGAQLQNALLNLAINARDAMEGQGTLVVTTTNATLVHRRGAVPAGDWVVLSVRDDGVGMSTEVLQQAVEPFFTTKPEATGSGLGLSMVYGFMTQSGGHLVIDSVEGEGTTCSLYLPRQPDGETVEQNRSTQLVLPVGDGKLVLVVEDDPRVMRATDAMVRSLGYRTLQSIDASQALDLLAQERVDIVFSDILLPGMNGAELRHEILTRHPGTAILLTSGFATDVLSDPRNAEAALLPKPFSRTQLAAALAAALGSHEHGRDA